MTDATALRHLLRGDQTSEDARLSLLTVGRDATLSPIARGTVALALLELRQGRTVRSTMARLRREVGLDEPKKPSSDRR